MNNLGSLAARFIFRPIEDSGYFYFTQMVKRDQSLSDQNPVSSISIESFFNELLAEKLQIFVRYLIFGKLSTRRHEQMNERLKI